MLSIQDHPKNGVVLFAYAAQRDRPSVYRVIARSEATRQSRRSPNGGGRVTAKGFASPDVGNSYGCSAERATDMQKAWRKGNMVRPPPEIFNIWQAVPRNGHNRSLHCVYQILDVTIWMYRTAACGRGDVGDAVPYKPESIHPRIPYAERIIATSREGPMVLFHHRPARTNCPPALPGEFHTQSVSQRTVERAQWCHLNTGPSERIVPRHCRANSIRRA